MNHPTKEEMHIILANEIEQLDSEVKEYITKYLVPIEDKILKWEYGNEEEFPAWVIADLQERDVGIVYCKGGHGAYGDTWGLIFFQDDYFGMDAGWYSTLAELISDGRHQST